MSAAYQPTERITLQIRTADLAVVAARAAAQKMTMDAYVSSLLANDAHGKLVAAATDATSVLSAAVRTIQNAADRGELATLPLGAVADMHNTIAQLSALVGPPLGNRHWHPSPLRA